MELIPAATTLKKIHPGFYWSKEVCKDALKQNSSMGCQVHPSWSPHPPLPYYYPLLPAMPSTRGPPLTSSWKSAFRFATTICQPSREAGRQATNRPAGRPRSSFKWRANEEEPWNWLLTLREEEEEDEEEASGRTGGLTRPIPN